MQIRSYIYIYIYMSTFQWEKIWRHTKKSCGSNGFYIQDSCLEKLWNLFSKSYKICIHKNVTLHGSYTYHSYVRTVPLKDNVALACSKSPFACSIFFALCTSLMLFCLSFTKRSVDSYYSNFNLVEAWNNSRVLTNTAIECHPMYALESKIIEPIMSIKRIA